MKILFLATQTMNASLNMATDEYLLRNFETYGEPILRFYKWLPKAISLGRFQNLSEINEGYCQKHNIDIVRRQTGGKAVLHASELTYSFIFPQTYLSKSVMESYHNINTALCLGLSYLGIQADTPKRKEPIKDTLSEICFSKHTSYDITIQNKKIIGSAQRRVQKKILQHGSILIDVNYEELAHCFNNIEPETAIEHLKNTITAIHPETNYRFSEEEIEKAILQGFQNHFKAEIIPISLSPDASPSP